MSVGLSSLAYVLSLLLPNNFGVKNFLGLKIFEVKKFSGFEKKFGSGRIVILIYICKTEASYYY